MKKLIMAAVIASLIGACGSKKPENVDVAITAPVVPEAVSPEPLDVFTLSVMDFSKCKGSSSAALSPARKKLLAKQIARILDEIGGAREVKETFVLLMCIESRFRPDAKSGAGAMGISQVMPETGKGVAKEIGLGEISKDDLLDPEINIRLGYSYFLGLVKEFGGNFAKAAAGYNSGPASSSVKAMGYLGQGHPETGWYVGNLYNLKEELRLAQK